MATALSQIQLYPNYEQDQILVQHSEILKAVRYELQRVSVAHQNAFRRSYTLNDLFLLLKQIRMYNPACSALYTKSLHYVARELGGYKVSFLPATTDITTYPIQIPVPAISLTYGYFTTKKYGSIVTNGLLKRRMNIADAFIYRTNNGWVLSLLTD